MAVPHFRLPCRFVRLNSGLPSLARPRAKSQRHQCWSLPRNVPTSPGYDQTAAPRAGPEAKFVPRPILAGSVITRNLLQILKKLNNRNGAGQDPNVVGSTTAAKWEKIME